MSYSQHTTTHAYLDAVEQPHVGGVDASVDVLAALRSSQVEAHDMTVPVPVCMKE